MASSVMPCTSAQYGQLLATDTPVATASLLARSATPWASRVSRRISHDAASVSGAAECRAVGGASMPNSRSTCR